MNVSVEEITERRQLEEERARPAQARAQASRLQEAREEERTRVARELHDEIGQALTAMKLGLRSVAGQIAPARPSWIRWGFWTLLSTSP